MTDITRPISVPARFQSITQLGALQGVFPAREKPWQRRLYWLLAGLGLGGAVALGTLSAYLGILRYQKYGPAMVWISLQALILGGLLLFALGGLALWRALSARRDCAVLYSAGIALDSPLGMACCRWDEISGLQSLVTRRYLNGIFSGVARACTLTRRDGERLVLSDRLERAGTLIQSVRERAFAVMYPRLAQAFDGGAAIRFGALTIQRDAGITYRRKALLWEQIAAARVEGGRLALQLKSGPVVKIPAERIVNLDVLLAILELVVRVT